MPRRSLAEAIQQAAIETADGALDELRHLHEHERDNEPKQG